MCVRQALVYPFQLPNKMNISLATLVKLGPRSEVAACERAELTPGLLIMRAIAIPRPLVCETWLREVPSVRSELHRPCRSTISM